MSNPIFQKLEVGLWRQYNSVSIEFHPRLTVITGTNGSGKSTLLSLLSQHFGWSRQFLSVPRKSRDGSISYLSGIVKDIRNIFSFRTQQPNSIGNIHYTNGQQALLILNDSNSWNNGVSISGQAPVEGLLIDSHRPYSAYSQVGQIPMQPMTAQQSYANYNAEMISRYNNNGFGNSPVYRLKESLISMGIFGEGNKTLGGSNSTLMDTYNGFNAVLRKLLPDSLGFQEIAIRVPEVVLVTDSGDFMLDASSGGIMTIIDVAWRIYMYSRDKEDFVVIMDEPENHLHPSMQRTLMRRLLDAFPRTQFVIATHSPFMITSVKDSYVYVLRYKKNENNPNLTADVGISAGRAVYSERLSQLNKAAPANEILREVLGVPATIPEWVEDDITRTVQKYKGRHFSSELLDGLRNDLTQMGYEDYFADAVGRLTNVR